MQDFILSPGTRLWNDPCRYILAGLRIRETETLLGHNLSRPTILVRLHEQAVEYTPFVLDQACFLIPQPQMSACRECHCPRKRKSTTTGLRKSHHHAAVAIISKCRPETLEKNFRVPVDEIIQLGLFCDESPQIYKHEIVCSDLPGLSTNGAVHRLERLVPVDVRDYSRRRDCRLGELVCSHDQGPRCGSVVPDRLREEVHAFFDEHLI